MNFLPVVYRSGQVPEIIAWGRVVRPSVRHTHKRESLVVGSRWEPNQRPSGSIAVPRSPPLAIVMMFFVP